MNAEDDAEEFVFYEVLMTREAEEDYKRASRSPRFSRVDMMLDILEAFPGVGRIYDHSTKRQIFPTTRELRMQTHTASTI